MALRIIVDRSPALGITLALPDEWQVLRTDRGDLVAGAPSSVVRGDTDWTQLPLSVFVRRLDDMEPAHADGQIGDLMARRAGGAVEPDHRSSHWDADTLDYLWTDGILDLISRFCHTPHGRWYEVTLGRDPFWIRTPEGVFAAGDITALLDRWVSLDWS